MERIYLVLLFYFVIYTPATYGNPYRFIQSQTNFIDKSHFPLSPKVAENCPIKELLVGITKITTIYYPSTDTCWVSVHDDTAYKTLIYRDYLFGNDGLFFVFNSFGEGPPSQKTGAREFYTFPRLNEPTFEIDPHNPRFINITLASGELVTINGDSARVVAMSQSHFVEDPQVHPKNRGGFEIKNQNQILLDCGFLLGNSPTSRPNNKCRFSDPQGNQCEVKAREIFKYDADGDTDHIYEDDKKLAQFLNRRCKNLDTSPLF